MCFLGEIFILVYVCVKLVTVRDFIDKLKRSLSWKKKSCNEKKST